jgi:hypothetical protein
VELSNDDIESQAYGERMMSDESDKRLRVGDPVKLRDSDMDLRGDVWQLRTGRYVIVRWQDECRSTHSEAAIEIDNSRNRAEWSRLLATEDR